MKGVLLKSTGSWYNVLTADNKIVACRMKGVLRLDELKTTNPIAVGDELLWELEPGQESGVITEVLPRRNYIIRSDPHKKAHRHILAANIDQCIIVAALKNPRVPLGFIDRFSVIAEAYHIPLIIIFNKSDLYDVEEMEKFEEAKNIYENIGYTVLLMSIINGTGKEELHQLLKNKTTLISGQSGVGKSALLNMICPDLQLKTNNVSRWNNKGQHTTTFAEMHKLHFGGYIIDTPGVKEFGMMDMEAEEVSHYFPEMRKVLNQCRFNNCMHRDEPGCAVKLAYEKQEIAELRYTSYFNILDEIENGLKFWEKK